MHFELVYQTIDDFGRFQKYIIYTGGFVYFYNGLIFLDTFFTLYIPEYR